MPQFQIKPEGIISKWLTWIVEVSHKVDSEEEKLSEPNTAPNSSSESDQGMEAFAKNFIPTRKSETPSSLDLISNEKANDIYQDLLTSTDKQYAPLFLIII